MKIYSKYLFVLTFITFFFPFCNLSCKKEAPAERTITDSVAVETPVEETPGDTSLPSDSGRQLVVDTIPSDSSHSQVVSPPDTAGQAKAIVDTISLGEKITKKILLPDDNNLSLWGLFYFYQSVVPVVVFFVFVVLAGVYRFFTGNDRGVAVYLGISVLALATVQFLKSKDDFVWGYWVMLGMTALNFLVSLIAYFKVVHGKTD